MGVKSIIMGASEWELTLYVNIPIIFNIKVRDNSLRTLKYQNNSRIVTKICRSQCHKIKMILVDCY